MSSYIGPRSADVPVGTIATKGTVSANSLVIGTNNATIGNSFYVAANGNVGVGTTPTTRKLYVNGDMVVNTNLIVGSYSLNDVGIRGYSNNSIGVYGGSDSSHGIYGQTNSGYGSISYSIGSGTAALVQSDGTGQAFYALANTNVGARIFSKTGNPLYVGNVSSIFMGVYSGGNVGIGSTNPLSKLVVSDAGSYGIEFQPNDTNRAFIITYNRSGAAYYPLHFTSSTYNFRDTSGGYSMVIDGSGNMGIGTTTPRSKFTLKGRRRTIASPASSSYEENRWYSHEGHYNISSVDNNAYSNLLMFRPYQNGTTSDPPGSSLWTRVGVEVRIGGHSSAIGSGDRWARYSLDYNGSGCSGATTLQDLATTNAPRVTFSISGWQVILQVSGAGGAGGSLGGYCYVSVHFGGGEGSYGEAIEWSLTEYL